MAHQKHKVTVATNALPDSIQHQITIRIYPDPATMTLPRAQTRSPSRSQRGDALAPVKIDTKRRRQVEKSPEPEPQQQLDPQQLVRSPSPDPEGYSPTSPAFPPEQQRQRDYSPVWPLYSLPLQPRID